MNTSKDVINNNKLDKFLTKNNNVKNYIYQYNKNDFHCCVCLDNSIEKDDKIIKYNHCGIIYIHEICLYDWFFENNGCILCKKMMIEKEEDTKSNSIFNNTINHNTISHNRYQHFFNINDNEGVNYDNETGNDIPHLTHIHHIPPLMRMHPIRIHNIPSFTFCLNIMKIIPTMFILIIIYEIIIIMNKY